MKKTFRELYIQDEITKKINNDYGLYPFSLFFTYNKNIDGFLSITFYYKEDLSEFLKKVNYQSQCDQSGYIIFEESNTIILVNIALTNLLNGL